MQKVTLVTIPYQHIMTNSIGFTLKRAERIIPRPQGLAQQGEKIKPAKK